jgi:hypothetical protein
MSQQKKKLKRVQVGSVCKSKEAGQPDYIKMRDGKIYRLESKKFQLDSLEKAVNEGKLSGEVVDQIKERIEKLPDFVRFEIIELVEKD